MKYTRAELETVIREWESGPTWENVEARTDLLRVRATLPERERMTLFYLCQGLLAKEIAQKLLVSPRTAATLVRETQANVLRKLNEGASA